MLISKLCRIERVKRGIVTFFEYSMDLFILTKPAPLVIMGYFLAISSRPQHARESAISTANIIQRKYLTICSYSD